MSSEVRQRPGKGEKAPTSNSTAVQDARPNGGWLIEVGRVITFLFCTSCLLSWFITKEDFWWGHRPLYTKVDYWKTLMTGPLQLTDAQLRAYDGSDPSKPIYLAINGTIYDVSNGRGFYGPGGSYSFFAGADASRAYVTSCFDTDITPDLRGAEEMYLPTSTPEIDALYSSGELKAKKEQERRQAHTQVYNGLKHWVDFFANSPKYQMVGTVKREEGWLEKLPKRDLCQKARDGRPQRGTPPPRA